ncbi:hypothetical protein HPB48_017070 [Haemaphysalis longicornis]|uniref:Glucose-methanol-choline oxidoreductase N-terminal domain-containing protein n=1 Tax=Haemaphysalis longicornis TaxID=44386 RepID=A0A9J6GJ06_HAELO|nr:hypothetical protein HPB48_017070 [Haemaphysalis longicornis]
MLWCFFFFFSLEPQRSPWPRGKALGGSSVVNFMMYVRGNRRDYDGWGSEYGVRGWSYDELLPHFKNIEHCHIDAYSNNGYHGSSGELPCAYASTQTLVSDVFLEAGKELGYEFVDYNGAKQTGGPAYGNKCRGTLSQIYKHFVLLLSGGRPNLHITLLSKATRVLFEGKRAVGVEFERDADKMRVRARREVILSAGTIGSPHLLLLSGVGPRAQLEEFQVRAPSDD